MSTRSPAVSDSVAGYASALGDAILVVAGVSARRGDSAVAVGGLAGAGGCALAGVVVIGGDSVTRGRCCAQPFVTTTMLTRIATRTLAS
jgi:hypothetical protein